ncbi:hypothetical protein YC2023_077062 [Brassica napus]
MTSPCSPRFAKTSLPQTVRASLKYRHVRLVHKKAQSFTLHRWQRAHHEIISITVRSQQTFTVLLLVLTATLAGDYARRDAALAGDCVLGHDAFLLTANCAFINVII